MKKSTLLQIISITGMILLISCSTKKESKSVDPLIDHRDGKVYSCKQIGNQTWMLENLAYYTKDDNSVYYTSDSLKYSNYGRLYLAEDVMEAANIPGWHLPDTNEWLQLLEFYNLENGNSVIHDNSSWSEWEREHATDIMNFISNDANGFNYQLGGMWHLKWLDPNSQLQRCFQYMGYRGYYWAAPIDSLNLYTHIYVERIKLHGIGVSKEKPTRRGGNKYRFYIRLIKD